MAIRSKLIFLEPANRTAKLTTQMKNKLAVSNTVLEIKIKFSKQNLAMSVDHRSTQLLVSDT